MRLVTFSAGGDPTFRLGALTGADRVLDLRQAAALCGGAQDAFLSMRTLIEAGPRGLDRARALLDQPPPDALRAAAAVALHAPLPRPAQLRDFLSFEQHLRQAFEASIRLRAARADDPARAEASLRASGRFEVPEIWYRQPVYYKGNRFSISGPGDTIVWPAYSEVMDYELELAAVIGTGGRDISRQAALDHVFGFTVFNDFSARDAQTLEMQGMLGPAKGKDFDGANAFGPCITTLDDIGDPYDLAMIARVNGEQRSRGSSGTMHWKFEDMIAHASRSETLYPGEVIGSGTVGDGCGLELGRFLRDGDVVELEIERIGVLRNRVVRAGG